MDGGHFYVTLPSNSSMDVFPNNTLTSFRVQLPHTIDLNGDCEVGLYSVIYPRTWYNLQKRDSLVYYSDDGIIFSSNFVEHGFFKTPQELVSAVNKALSPSKGGVTLSFDKLTEKVTISPRSGYYFGMTGTLSLLLGFGGKDVKVSTVTTSPYVVDITGAMTSIFVYSDIVQPQLVGDMEAPLLRSIPIQGRSGEIVNLEYTNIKYVPVQKKSFENIEILIRDDTGKPVPFESGKVLVTLHFRKTSPYFTSN